VVHYQIVFFCRVSYHFLLLLTAVSDDSLKGSLLDHQIVKHWVKAIAEAQGSERQSQMVKEALDDPAVAEFVEHAFRCQESSINFAAHDVSL